MHSMQKEHAMKNPSLRATTVVLHSATQPTLTAHVYASRETLVTVEKVDDCFPSQGAKLTIDLDQMLPGDFVVRSVLAGNRRFIELLAYDPSSTPLDALQNLLELAGEPRQYIDDTRIEFDNGHSIITLRDSSLMAAPKGR